MGGKSLGYKIKYSLGLKFKKKSFECFTKFECMLRGIYARNHSR